MNQANAVNFLAADLVNNLNFCRFHVVGDRRFDLRFDLWHDRSDLRPQCRRQPRVKRDGQLDETAAVIVGGTSNLAATTEICLTGGDCDGDGLNDNDFVGQVTATGTTVEIADANALTVGTISAVNDIFLRSGDNGVGSLRLNGNLTTSAANGQVLLQSDSGVVQTGGVMTTSQLLLGGNNADEGTGNYVLNRANVVDRVAADLVNNLSFVDSTSLVIADLTYDSVCGTTELICGLNVGGDLVMSVTGSLTQTAAVIVGGTSNLAATNIICLTGGDCSGDGLNDNDFVGQVSATARTVEIVDANALIVGNITAVNDVFLRSGDNGVGSLRLNGNLTTSAANGQVLLQSDSGVTQAAGTAITTHELLLGGNSVDEGSGNFVLTRDNVVNRLAADLVNNLNFADSTSLEIAELNYASACGTNEAIVGLDIGGNSTLNVIGDLTQTANAFINGNASFVASDSIVLADNVALFLSVGQNASFNAPLIEVGQDDFDAAAVGNVDFGSLTVNGGTAIITEDSGGTQIGTEMRGINILGGNFSLASFGNITNVNGTELQVTSAHSQFNSFGNVFLGNRENDIIELSDVGIVANSAYLGLNGVDPTNLDGRDPSLDPTVFGESSSFGTFVQDILFIDSEVAITQVQRAGGPSSLNVGQLAINSDQYVHLSSIAARNTAVAINANSAAPVTDAVALQQLELLANPNRISATQVLVQDQSVSLVHEGTLNVSSVIAPIEVFNPVTMLPEFPDPVIGIRTTDGSIFISAVDQINITENIEAEDSGNDEAQVTVYVSSPGATAANIDVSAEIRVSDSGNEGVVTESQTFSFVFQPSSAVEAGEGTNFILVLNANGTADQSVQVLFGNPGEVGYRVGVIWDSQNSIGQPVENPNLFVPFFPDPLNPMTSENYPDFEAFLTFAFANLGVNVFDINSVIANIFNKIEAFSQDAIINHQFDQNVFTTIVVRNDQNINLFVGDETTVDNSLNESITTVRSQFDNFPEVSGLASSAHRSQSDRVPGTERTGIGIGSPADHYPV